MVAFSALRKPFMLAEICKDLGLVFFASVFLGPLLGGAHDIGLLIFGSILSLIFLVMALYLARE